MKNQNKLLQLVLADLRKTETHLEDLRKKVEYLLCDGKITVDCNSLRRHDKIVYSKTENGYDHDKEKCKKLLVEGQVYTVRRVEVHSSSSTLELVEVPGERFNTVMFSEYHPELETL